MEYYTWVDLLGIERREFEEHAEAIEKHCKRLYVNFENAAAEERKREENSKSQDCQKIRTNENDSRLNLKIKYRNEKR